MENNPLKLSVTLDRCEVSPEIRECLCIQRVLGLRALDCDDLNIPFASSPEVRSEDGLSLLTDALSDLKEGIAL